MLRATGIDNGRTVALAVLPGTEGAPNRLYWKTPDDLWDRAGEETDLTPCLKAAWERFGVEPGAWSEGTFATIDMVQAYAKDAIEFARERFQVELDLTPGSIEHVERILAKLYDQRPRGFKRLLSKGPSAEEIASMAKMFGSYVGEVIRREHGGEWSTASNAFPGQSIMTLHAGGLDIFPPAKVHKRLTNGPEDNVWFYYRVMKAELHA